MRKLFILFAVGTSIVTCAGVEAMPLNAHIVSSGGVFTPVNSECGIGVHRGPYDRCVPIYPVYPVYPVNPVYPAHLVYRGYGSHHGVCARGCRRSYDGHYGVH